MSTTVPIEYEARILNIDPDTVTKNILDHGGQPLGEAFQRRYVYDINPDDPTRWIRLRDNGTTTTLAIKHITSSAIDGTHELEISVNDFSATNEILAALGYTPKAYQENRRISYQLGPTRLDIDHWPHIPPYLEIEATTEQDILATAALLGYTENDLTTDNTITIYAHHGIDLNTTPELRFPTPA